MAIIKRNELANSLGQILSDEGPRLFLIFGERYLCRKTADKLQEELLRWQDGTAHPIDGDQEDPSLTLAKLNSYSLLPGLQIYRVDDTRLFHSKNISQSVWQKACNAQKAGKTAQALKYLADLYGLAAISAKDRQPLSEYTEAQWQQLFGMARPADVQWANTLFNSLTELPAHHSVKSDHATQYLDCYRRGVVRRNVLILVAESVDKRKKLYTFIKEKGLIIDCSVAEGSGAAALKVQKSVLQEVMQNTLDFYDKTIDPGAIDIFLERVGFHPVAVAVEIEKIALYTDERKKITLQDLHDMVGRSREDALFELTDNIGKGTLTSTLQTLHHLQENGIHALAILATMRNYFRKLLIFRSLQMLPSPVYNRRMAAKQFQDSYLPQLRERGEWLDVLKGHPYALFMGFAQAAEFRCSTLKLYLEQVLVAEFRMKGSIFPDRLILEHLLISMLKKRRSA